MLTRACDSCGQTIKENYYSELSIAVLETDGPEVQDLASTYSGDYCQKCILNGSAVKDLLDDIERDRKDGQRK